MPFSKDGAQPEYEMLGWVKDDGKAVFLPHLMRNYFISNWFDWHLKDSEAARRRLLDHPFSNGVQMLLEDGVARE